MNPMDPSNYMPEEVARHLAEQRQLIREADSVVRYAHSRSGLLARFLQRMADGIDPTGAGRAGALSRDSVAGTPAVVATRAAEKPPYLLNPAAAAPALAAWVESAPASSALTAAVANRWARGLSSFMSMFASENQAQ